MTEEKRRLLIGLLVVIFLGIVGLQLNISPERHRMWVREQSRTGAKSGDFMAQLPGEFVVASFTGFKEVIAGSLWIRADDFFHRGQYKPIIPIVRMVTWLDPHNIDVYITGAWHLDYNFVDDANSLSDKRYIPAAVALMKEGIRNNPDVWDLYFELGWTHYSKKLMDDVTASKYISEACKYHGLDMNTGEKQPRPEFVDRMSAHLLAKIGRYDEAIKEWRRARARCVKAIEMNKKKPGSGGWADQGSLDLCDRNLSLLLMRLGWRYGKMDRYEQGLKIAQRLKGPADWVAATASAREDYGRRKGTSFRGDTAKPVDAKFKVSWLRAGPKMLLIRGTCNIIPAEEYKGLASEAFTHWYEKNQKAGQQRVTMRDGSRVYWRIEDYDYKMPDLDNFTWKIDLDETIAWGDIYVGGGSFNQTINMGKAEDSEIYPFKAKTYKLTVWMDPVDPGMPDYVEDRVGWKGEALTDKECLDLSMRPGYHMLKKEFILKRSDII